MIETSNNEHSTSSAMHPGLNKPVPPMGSRKVMNRIVKKIRKRPLNLFRTFSSDASVFSIGTAATEQSEDTIETEPVQTRKRVIKSGPEQTGKHVAFAPDVMYNSVIGLHDFTIEELEVTWWQSDEYLEISKRCSKQIHKMDRGDKLRDKKYCARGLEQHTRLGSAMKSKIRSASIDAVLHEQSRQFCEKITDDETISAIYHDVTSSSQMWASAIGLQDQKTAEMVEDDYEELEITQASSPTANFVIPTSIEVPLPPNSKQKGIIKSQRAITAKATARRV